jgi:hypothetical protein
MAGHPFLSPRLSGSASEAAGSGPGSPASEARSTHLIFSPTRRTTTKAESHEIVRRRIEEESNNVGEKIRKWRGGRVPVDDSSINY